VNSTSSATDGGASLAKSRRIDEELGAVHKLNNRLSSISVRLGDLLTRTRGFAGEPADGAAGDYPAPDGFIPVLTERITEGHSLVTMIEGQLSELEAFI
jgi:hypothetical protein